MFKRTLDFKHRSYSIELCLLPFYMMSDFKVIKLGNDCLTIPFA